MECSAGVPNPWLVGTEFICNPAYDITQADIDAGGVNNTIM